jgi:hypothetical protein
VNEQREAGKSLRQTCPRSSHAIWKPPVDRPDPLRSLEQSNNGRIAELIPIRYGRMVRTPFTFYRFNDFLGRASNDRGLRHSGIGMHESWPLSLDRSTPR